MTDQRTQVEFNAMDYLSLLWRRRKLFLLPFIVVTVAGLGVGSLIPKGYESKTITKVVERNYLDKLYKGVDVAPPPSIELGTAKYQIASTERLAEILDAEGYLAHCRSEVERQETIDRIKDKIDVEVVEPKIGGGDKLLIISFIGSSPFQAQNLVKSITQDNISRIKLSYRENIRGTRDTAIEEQQRAQARYDEAQDNLQDFLERHTNDLMGGEVPLIERNIERDQEKMENLVSETLKLDGQIRYLEFTLSGLNQEDISYDRVPNPEYEALNEQVQTQKAVVETLSVGRQDDHPIVRQARELYKTLKAKLDATEPYLRNEQIRKPNPRWEEVNIELQQATADRDHARSQRVKLSEKLSRARERVKLLPTIRTEHKKLEDAVDRAQEKFKEFAKLCQQAETTYARVTSTLDDLFVPIERASKPLKHTTPPPELILLISLALGLAAGVGTVLVAEMSRKTFHSPEDVAALLSWPVIGVVHTILSRQEQRQRARKRAAAVVATLIVAIGLSTVVYIYNRNPDLLPDFLVDSVQKFRGLV
jgi:capsular polysaccharide biosynthesis protein